MSFLSDFISSGGETIILDLEKKRYTSSSEFVATQDCVLIGYIYGGSGGGGGGGINSTSGYGFDGHNGGESNLKINGQLFITTPGGRGGKGANSAISSQSQHGCRDDLRGANGAAAGPPLVSGVTDTLNLMPRDNAGNKGGAGGSCFYAINIDVFYGGMGGRGSGGAKKEFAFSLKEGDVLTITIGAGGSGGLGGSSSLGEADRGYSGARGYCEFDVYNYWELE